MCSDAKVADCKSVSVKWRRYQFLGSKNIRKKDTALENTSHSIFVLEILQAKHFVDMIT